MISENASIGRNVTIKPGVIIEDNVKIGDNAYIDYNTIIKENVEIGDNAFIGANCILGEVLADFFADRVNKKHPLVIGANATIRSGSILYGDSAIGDNFGTGHRVTIREKTQIGHHVNIGTLSDLQGDLIVGNYVHLHSNVHLGMKTVLKDYCWIFPYCVLTNDPTPPSEVLLGATVEEFAVVCTGVIVLPGVVIGQDALVGAKANVTKSVSPYAIAVGNPAKEIGDVRNLKNKSGDPIYPWRYSFDRGMPWRGVGYDQWLEQHAK